MTSKEYPMADFKDIRKICREYNVKMIHSGSPSGDSLCAYYSDRELYIAEPWYNTDEEDDLFEIIKYIGWIVVKANSNYKREKESVIWAIRQAAELKIHISHSKVISTQNELNEYGNREKYQYDFDSIAVDHTLQELMNMYQFPFFVQKPSWTPNFYFRAEYVDSNGWVRGTAFRDGKEYLVKEYRYKPNNIMHIYGEDNSLSDDDTNYNGTIKKRIKDSDDFAEVKTDDTFLLAHQKAGLLLSGKYDKFAYFYDTGTGKTIMTLSIIKRKNEEKQARFLIIAPKAIIRSAWMNDSETFFPTMKIAPLSNNYTISDYHELYLQWMKNGLLSKYQMIAEKDWNYVLENYYWSETQEKKKAEIISKVISYADHYIINIEKYRANPSGYIDLYPVDGLIVDESAILKNPNSVSAKTMFSSASCFKYIYLLSGKPAPNNSTEYYAQMKLVDPISFSMSFNTFKKRFFTGNGSNIKFISGEQEKRVAGLISRRSLTISKEDCLSLPSIEHETITINLPSSIMRHYNQLLNDCIIEIKKQDTQRAKTNIFYSTTSRLAVFTKLRELASGFIMDKYGQTADLHKKKIEALHKLVKQNSDEQMVIWCQFEHEIRLVENALKPFGEVVTAYGKTKNIDDSIISFRRKSVKYLIAHPKSLKYGVTFTNCCISVYYSMSYSAEDYYQSRDRIYRLGQKRNCTYYYLLSKDTIDETMFDCVRNKMSYAEVFSEIIKSAEKHGIRYSDFKNDQVIPDDFIATQRVKEEYGFTLLDDYAFTYHINSENTEGILYNKMLIEKQSLRPEEILFEIGYNELLGDIATVTSKDIEEVTKWVSKTMRRMHIKQIPKVHDYLEEQIDKQKEIDEVCG